MKFLFLRKRGDFASICFRLYRTVWEFATSCRVFEIVSNQKHIEAYGGKSSCIENDRSGIAANVVVAGQNDKQVIKDVDLPDLMLYEHHNVIVNYGSDVILNDDKRLAINDYCANKNDNNLGYEDSITYYEGGGIVILKKYDNNREIETGIRLDGKFSYNYYHNVYENLIKLLVIEKCNDQIPSNVPLIVDSIVFEIPSFKRIFEILSNKLQRDVVSINKREGIRVHTLYSVSAVNYIVPSHKDSSKVKIEEYVFNDKMLALMRKRLLAHKSDKIFPKRIFITRKSANHRKINEEELFEILRPLGFEVIAPENYTFEEQMSIFNGAEWIVGCSGAAFTNLMFCSQGCIVICLDRFGYAVPVFTAPACIVGARMYNFYSERNSSKEKIHSNFVINAEKFGCFVKDFMEPLMDK